MARFEGLQAVARALSVWLGFSRSANIWTRLRHFIGSPAGAVLGAVLFALWAALVNHDGGFHVSLRSGAGQFAASVALTVLDARLMMLLFHACKDRRLGAALSAVGSLAFSYGLVIGVHLALGTPHILLTILPGLPPTIGFTVVYTMLLMREHASRD